jgi:hypothetical protein
MFTTQKLMGVERYCSRKWCKKFKIWFEPFAISQNLSCFRWLLLPTERGVGKEGNITSLHCTIYTIYIIYHIYHIPHTFCIYSIGCGIGYGYLHRIPLRDEAHRPKEAPVITPAPDGFSEVQLRSRQEQSEQFYSICTYTYLIRT